MIELDPALQAALEEAARPLCDAQVGEVPKRHGVPAQFVLRTMCDHKHRCISMVCEACEATMSRGPLACPACRATGHLCAVVDRSTERISG